MKIKMRSVILKDNLGGSVAKFKKGDMLYLPRIPDFEIEVMDVLTANCEYLIEYKKVPIDKSWIALNMPVLFSYHRVESDCELISNYQSNFDQVNALNDLVKFVNEPITCECGQDKIYKEMHRMKCPLHKHSTWCKLYKE